MSESSETGTNNSAHGYGKPGAPFQPSNGTEGEIFEADFCERCDHWRPRMEIYDDPEILDCTIDVEKGLSIFMAVQSRATNEPDYPKQWTYDAAGWPTCLAWKQRTAAADAPVVRLCGGAYTAAQERAAYEAAMAMDPSVPRTARGTNDEQ